MKKGIEIQGELKEKGSTANILNTAAAADGKSLTKYIYDLLNEHAKKIKLYNLKQ